MKLSTVPVILFICLAGLVTIEARGGRGGGFRGGRSSRFRSGRASSRYRSAYSGHRLSSKSTVRSALLLGTVYGASRWRMRRPHYHYDDDDLPEICYNDKYKQNEYGNVSYYGRFVCPTDSQNDDHHYCCGEEGLQTCCTFWEDGGRVAGAVIGIILAVVAVIVFFCILVHCMKKRRLMQRQSNSRTRASAMTWSQNKPDSINHDYKSPMPETDLSNSYTTPYPPPSQYGVPPPPYTTGDTTATNGYAPYPTTNGNSAPYPT